MAGNLGVAADHHEGVEPRERRAVRILARTLAWVVAVPLGLVGAGAVVQQGQTYRQHRLEDDRAHAVLVDWAQAVTSVAAAGRRFVPVGDLTAQVGDWEPEVGENDKAALLSGQVEASPTARFESPPGQGVVRWADGVTTSVPLLSPVEGVEDLGEQFQSQGKEFLRPKFGRGLALADLDVSLCGHRPAVHGLIQPVNGPARHRLPHLNGPMHRATPSVARQKRRVVSNSPEASPQACGPS